MKYGVITMYGLHWEQTIPSPFKPFWRHLQVHSFLLLGLKLSGLALPSFHLLIKHHLIATCTLAFLQSSRKLDLNFILELPRKPFLISWSLSRNNVESLLFCLLFFFSLISLCPPQSSWQSISVHLPILSLMTRAAINVLVQVKAGQRLYVVAQTFCCLH